MRILMEQTLMVQMVVEKDGAKFTFSMPMGSKIGAAYDAAFEVLDGITKMAQEAAKKAEPVAVSPEQVQEAASSIN